LLAPGQSVTHTLGPNRRGYVFVITGELTVNGQRLQAGDQARVSAEKALQFSGPASGLNAPAADFLFLDLP
jgi:quercetin 2,3-dioxygenase